MTIKRKSQYKLKKTKFLTECVQMQKSMKNAHIEKVSVGWCDASARWPHIPGLNLEIDKSTIYSLSAFVRMWSGPAPPPSS